MDSGKAIFFESKLGSECFNLNKNVKFFHVYLNVHIYLSIYYLTLSKN